MALIKCPECGKENVSDSAESCPDCGYMIREHFKRIQTDADLQREKEHEKEEDEKLYNSIAMPAKIALIPNWLWVLSIIITIFLIFFIHSRSFNPATWIFYIKYFPFDIIELIIFAGAEIALVGTLFIIFIVLRYDKWKTYKYAKKHFEEYRKKEFQRQKAILNREKNSLIKCPLCGSKKISRIDSIERTASVAMFGFASGKIGKQYQCRNCKHMW